MIIVACPQLALVAWNLARQMSAVYTTAAIGRAKKLWKWSWYICIGRQKEAKFNYVF